MKKKVINFIRMLWYRLTAKQLLKDIDIYREWVDKLYDEIYELSDKYAELENKRRSIPLQDGIWRVKNTPNSQSISRVDEAVDEAFTKYCNKWGSVEQLKMKFGK